MRPFTPERERLAIENRVLARHLFEHALARSTVDQAFERHVTCERGVLRVCEDLYNLDSYSRVFVVALGKAAHSMANSLVMQAVIDSRGSSRPQSSPSRSCAASVIFWEDIQLRMRSPYALPRRS